MNPYNVETSQDRGFAHTKGFLLKDETSQARELDPRLEYLKDSFVLNDKNAFHGSTQEYKNTSIPSSE